MPAPREVGLGCMRLSTDAGRDGERAVEVLRAALDEGVTLLDTAAAYGVDEADAHHNERIVARAIAGRPSVRVVTKAGVVRRGSAWIADARAKSLRASCEESLAVLGRIDLFLLHAPDPKTSFGVSLRALRALLDARLVGGVGVCNVTRAQFEEARGEIPLAAVQVSVGVRDAPFRDGLVAACVREGVLVLAHSPFGGPARIRALSRDPLLKELAVKYETTAPSLLLAWLYGLDRNLCPLPGATKIDTAIASARASRLAIDEADRARLDARWSAGARAFGRTSRAAVRDDVEIVVVMGIGGAGKSRYVGSLAGYERLNRDDRGGTLRGVAMELDRGLAGGARRFVLDNTYCRRADRDRVIEVAERHGAIVRCVWIDTPLEDAQVNAVERLVARYGRLPDPDERLDDPQAFMPTAQLRMKRELEPPTLEEGFASVEIVPFVRAPRDGDRRGLIVASEALGAIDARRVNSRDFDAALVFGWRPSGGDAADAERCRDAHLGADVVIATCRHPAGPPRCWCRPPLPGLIVPWLHHARIDPARSLFVGVSPAHRKLASALGVPYRHVGEGGGAC